MFNDKQLLKELSMLLHLEKGNSLIAARQEETFI
jgi:hypothetical protein